MLTLHLVVDAGSPSGLLFEPYQSSYVVAGNILIYILMGLSKLAGMLILLGRGSDDLSLSPILLFCFHLRRM
jgi:hypothetical protein